MWECGGRRSIASRLGTIDIIDRSREIQNDLERDLDRLDHTKPDRDRDLG